MPRLDKNTKSFFHTDNDLDGNHVRSRCHHLVHTSVSEVKDPLDHPSLEWLDDPFFLTRLDNRADLFLSHLGYLRALTATEEKEDCVRRGRQHHDEGSHDARDQFNRPGHKK